MKLLNEKKNNKEKYITVAGLALALSLNALNPSINAYAAPAPTGENIEEEILGHIEPGYGITLENVYFIKFDTNEYYNDNHLSESNLEHIKEINFKYVDGTDYSYLSKAVNLERITMSFDFTENIDLSNISGVSLNKPVDIKLIPYYSSDFITSFDENNFGFLKDIPNIKSLTLGNTFYDNYYDSFIINQEFLEGLENVDTLDLYLSDSSNYNYKDLSNYKHIILHGKPYDVIMYLNVSNLMDLINKGITVEYDHARELVRIDESLKNVIDSLNISESATDKEKLDTLLEFILTNFNYSNEVAEALDTNDMSDVNIEDFYKNGFLEGAFKNPQGIICGNYMAILSSLSNYIDLNTYNVLSGDHAFNEVLIDGIPYVVDATWIDEEYGAGKTAAELFMDGEQDLYYLPYYLSNPEELYDLVWYDSHAPWITSNDFYIDNYDFSQMYDYFNSIVPLPEKVKTLSR